MEDLNLSESLDTSSAFNDTDLFSSFFFNENDQQPEDVDKAAILTHDAGLLSAASSPIESTSPADLSTPILSPLPSSLPTSELDLGFDMPPLFPSLDNLKLEDVEEEEILSSTSLSPAALHAESTCAATKQEPTSTTTTKSSNKKRMHPPTPTATPRKRAARQPKKQKVNPKEEQEHQSDFISSLKGLTSAELEKIPEERELNAREQEELKKYIRMIKNRESAQLSRERRRVYQDTLEQSFSKETDRNAALKQQILELEAENKVLKNEFLHFKGLIERSNLGQAFSSFAENNMLQTMTKSAAAGDIRAQATFAMYLLIVLHSFGQQLHSFSPIAKDAPAVVNTPVTVVQA